MRLVTWIGESVLVQMAPCNVSFLLQPGFCHSYASGIHCLVSVIVVTQQVIKRCLLYECRKQESPELVSCDHTLWFPALGRQHASFLLG